jgi:hypothetical protein
MGRNLSRPTLIALYLVPLLVAIAIRSFLPTYYEFESHEDTLRAMTMVEKGEVPLYGIGHIRFLGAALGPLVYYVKAIPLLISPHPVSEVYFLVLLHLTAIFASMLLMAGLIRGLLQAGRLSKKWPVDGPIPHYGAAAVGLLLALSQYAHALTLHAHPSFFAGAFVPILTLAVHRWSIGESDRWLILAGACLGIMTQFYQLALFAPFLLFFIWLGPRRRPNRRALVSLFLPIFICYLPYLVSELHTGFVNTAGLFEFRPGPGDDSSVGFSALNNLSFNFAVLTNHYGLPTLLSLPILVCALVGLVSATLALRANPGVSAILALGFVYTLLPMLLLKNVRFELSLPFGQVIIVLGALTIWPHARQLWRSRRPVAIGGALVALALTLIYPRIMLAHQIGTYDVTPIRMESAAPFGGMPTLEESEKVLTHLRKTTGVNAANARETIASPVVLSGLFGHRYLLRVLEESVPAGPPVEGTVFVVDRYFPMQVVDGTTEQVDDFSIHHLATRVTNARVTIDCAEEWCATASAAPLPHLVHRFFWTCKEYRGLDDRGKIPRHECEEVLTSMPYDHTWQATIAWGPIPDERDGCGRRLLIIHDPGCLPEVKIDGADLPLLHFPGMKRDYSLATVPLGEAMQQVSIFIPDCHSYTFLAVPFIGVDREDEERLDD